MLAIARSLALVTVLGLSACAQDQAPAKDPAAAKPYPLDTCIVSDEKLGGDMGAPVVVVKDGQEFKLCCKDCVKDLDQDPKKFQDKLAAAQQKPDAAKPAAGAADHADHDHAGHEHAK
jgi:hypothetical protein